MDEIRSVDPRCETPSFEENGEGYFLTGDTMRWFWDHYQSSAADRDSPYFAPLCSPNLADLPPATVITAEFDPLRDEGEAFAHKLIEAGIPCDLIRYPGVIHGFFGMHDMLPKARQAVEHASRNLRNAFRTT